MYKRCQVVMLPTNQKAKIGSLVFSGEHENDGGMIDDELRIVNNKHDAHNINEYLQGVIIPQHLYILSDENYENKDFTDGEWRMNMYILKNGGNPLQNHGNAALNKKIIATTDSSLIVKCDGCKRADKALDAIFLVYTCSCTPLPQPTQAFIEKYVSQHNKGNKIEEVMVEYDEHVWQDSPSIGYATTLKISSDNTITIKKIKDSYTREEVIKIWRRAYLQHKSYLVDEDRKLTFDEWIEENIT